MCVCATASRSCVTCDFVRLQIDFMGETQDDVDTWKAMFLRAGVYPESVGLDVNPLDDGTFGQNMDPILERQVETIRNLVDSYVKIVTKKIKDQIPKIVTCFLINKTREFINGDLLRTLLSEGEMLMEESQMEAQRREDLLRTYNSLKEALNIIGEVNMTTTYVPPPPPLKNDWRPPPPTAVAANRTSAPVVPPAPQLLQQQVKPTQSVPPRPKPNPAALFNPNQILQPTKAPVPSRPAPTIPVPPRR